MARKKSTNPLDTVAIGQLQYGESYGKRLIIPIQINGVTAIAVDLDLTTSGRMFNAMCCLAGVDNGELAEGRSTKCTIQRPIPEPLTEMPDEAEPEQT